jgi:soluble lytic murein transglycosylase-like protein
MKKHFLKQFFLILFIFTAFSLSPSLIYAANTDPLPNLSSPYDNFMDKYGMEYGVDPGKLKRMAKCESTFNPKAVNSIYGGLYQFSPATWRSTRKSMGLDADPNLRFDPEEAIKTTAFKIAHGGIRAWPVCGKK